MKHIQTSARRRIVWSAAVLAIGAVSLTPFRLVAADPAAVERKNAGESAVPPPAVEEAAPPAGKTGVVRAIAISSRRSGVVRKVHVREGEAVKAGQLLLELEDDEAQLRLRAAEIRRRVSLASLDAKLAELKAAEERSNPAAIRKTELQRALQQIEAERASLAQLLLTYTEGSRNVQEAREAIARLESKQKSLAGNEPKIEPSGAYATQAAFRARRAEAEAEAQLADIAVEEARLELKLHRIVSPCDGRVFKVVTYDGEAVAAQGRGEPVIVIETTIEFSKKSAANQGILN